MKSLITKFCSIILFVIAVMFAFPASINACTYESTITANHLDFALTSDLDKLALIQYIRQSGDALVTKIYAPEVAVPWSFFDDPNCNVGTNNPIACRQIRWSKLGEGAFWQWFDWPSYQFHVLPRGVWGLDFDSVPTLDSIGIEYGTTGGGDSWKFCTRTGDVTYPTPTPEPTTVTKTVFIPGFGASWNANAFANCTFDNNPNDWSLASYAESIYNPILTALHDSGWNVSPFYYDWRDEIPSNSSALANSINNSVVNGEKINIVGHSMGGLVAADFLVNHDQGVKTNSLLTVGSPLKGAVQSYPAWAGGDIWDDNFLTKIAKTLYLKHCGGLMSDNLQAVRTYIPSVKNLLPTFDYLSDAKTKTIKPVGSMNDVNKNNWSLNLNDLFGIKFGTLTGTNINTLSNIQTKEPRPKDVQSGYWLDGKPSGKIYSPNGDGTVLLSSSKFDEKHNTTINQSHTGLVNSSEGITEILKFLGTPPITSLNTSTPDPSSALVIIGYPSNFWITDQNGQTKKDKNGMVSLTNPKSGTYKLNLIPQTSNTLFVVAQLLPSGEIKYKEYKFEGYSPKLKKLNFSLENPQEDILN